MNRERIQLTPQDLRTPTETLPQFEFDPKQPWIWDEERHDPLASVHQWYQRLPISHDTLGNALHTMRATWIHGRYRNQATGPRTSFIYRVSVGAAFTWHQTHDRMFRQVMADPETGKIVGSLQCWADLCGVSFQGLRWRSRAYHALPVGALPATGKPPRYYDLATIRSIQPEIDRKILAVRFDPEHPLTKQLLRLQADLIRFQQVPVLRLGSDGTANLNGRLVAPAIALASRDCGQLPPDEQVLWQPDRPPAYWHPTVWPEFWRQPTHLPLFEVNPTEGKQSTITLSEEESRRLGLGIIAESRER